MSFIVPKNLDPQRHKKADYLSALFRAQDAALDVRKHCSSRNVGELPDRMESLLKRRGLSIAKADILRFFDIEAENRHVEFFPETLNIIADIFTERRKELTTTVSPRKIFGMACVKPVVNRWENNEYLKELVRLEKLFDRYVDNKNAPKGNMLYKSAKAYYNDVLRAEIHIMYDQLSRVRNCSDRNIFPYISTETLRACSKLLEQKAASLRLSHMAQNVEFSSK